jgi:archaellum biogenesis ATPase FlaH
MSTEANKTHAPIQELTVVNAYEIFMKDTPPTKWYVEPILHQGVCLLSGDPKVGKSFLALQVALAVAGGNSTVLGTLPVRTHGRVLYLALDDGSEGRIHKRLHQLTADGEATLVETALKNIDFVHQRNFPTLKTNLIEALQILFGDQPSNSPYELVVLDTLGTVMSSSNKSIYHEEYAQTILLKKFADEHNVCLIAVHHSNKSEKRDEVASASGSHGITGAVDCVALLSGDGDGQAKLMTRPRDDEETEFRLNRLSNGGWQVQDTGTTNVGQSLQSRLKTFQEAPGPVLSRAKKATLDELRYGPKSKDELAEALGIDVDAARKRLERLADEDLSYRWPDGRYGPMPETVH